MESGGQPRLWRWPDEPSGRSMTRPTHEEQVLARIEAELRRADPRLVALFDRLGGNGRRGAQPPAAATWKRLLAVLLLTMTAVAAALGGCRSRGGRDSPDPSSPASGGGPSQWCRRSSVVAGRRSRHWCGGHRPMTPGVKRRCTSRVLRCAAAGRACASSRPGWASAPRHRAPGGAGTRSGRWCCAARRRPTGRGRRERPGRDAAGHSCVRSLACRARGYWYREPVLTTCWVACSLHKTTSRLETMAALRSSSSSTTSSSSSRRSAS
jgi:hypothetical protein